MPSRGHMLWVEGAPAPLLSAWWPSLCCNSSLLAPLRVRFRALRGALHSAPAPLLLKLAGPSISFPPSAILPLRSVRSLLDLPLSSFGLAAFLLCLPRVRSLKPPAGCAVSLASHPSVPSVSADHSSVSILFSAAPPVPPLLLVAALLPAPGSILSTPLLGFCSAFFAPRPRLVPPFLLLALPSTRASPPPLRARSLPSHTLWSLLALIGLGCHTSTQGYSGGGRHPPGS